MSEDISMSNECHNHNAKAPCSTCAGLGCPLCDPGTPKPQTIRDAIEALGPHLRDQGEVMRQDSRYRAYVGKPPVLLPGTIVDLHLEDGSHRILREDGSIVWDNTKREPGLRIVGYRLPALRHPPTDFKPLFDGKCMICGFARGHHSSCSAGNPTREKRFRPPLTPGDVRACSVCTMQFESNGNPLCRMCDAQQKMMATGKGPYVMGIDPASKPDKTVTLPIDRYGIADWKRAERSPEEFKALYLQQPEPTRQHVTDAAWELIARDLVSRSEQEEFHHDRGTMIVAVEEWDRATANRVERFCFRDYENDVVDTCTGRVYRRHGIGRGLSADKRRKALMVLHAPLKDSVPDDAIVDALCDELMLAVRARNQPPSFRQEPDEVRKRAVAILGREPSDDRYLADHLCREIVKLRGTIDSLTRQLRSRRINEEPATTKPVFRYRPLV